jgi:hypothetical protein
MHYKNELQKLAIRQQNTDRSGLGKIGACLLDDMSSKPPFLHLLHLQKE